jgi:Domain of unknown function (DUF4838)
MMKTTTCVLLILLFMTPFATAAADEVEIVAGGKSDYVIAVAEDVGDARKIAQAADLLAALIARGTDVELSVVSETKVPAGKPAIYLGRSKAARQAGIPVDEVKGWGYLNRVVGRNVFLIGEDVPGWEKPKYTYSGHSGTLKAVTAFLESRAGVRFVLPGPMGIHVPKLERLTADAAMNVRWSPRFRFVIGRRVSPLSAKLEYAPYAVASNFFGRYSGDNRVFWSGGSHTWGDFVPRQKYFETNPDYFGLFRGKRDPLRRNILCLSSPAVKELLLKGMERKFDQGYQMVMLGQADGYIECRCAKCQAIHPEIGEKLWIYHRKLAEEMKKRRPGKQVVLLSYVWATTPPQTFDRFPDNVIIMNNRYVPEYFEAWKRFDTPRVVYFPEWLRLWPQVPPRMAVSLVRLWLENNVIGIYIGGGLDSYGSSWGLNGPSYYAFGKAMEDPTRDADELEREYVDASFGKAAGPMRVFFATMHRRLEVLELLTRREKGNPDRRYRGYPFTMFPGDFACHFFAPKVLNEMTSHLDRALRLAEAKDVKARLELVEAEFRYLRSIAAVQHAFRAYRVAPSWDALKVVEAHVKTYRETLDWLQPGGKGREPGGRRQLRTPFSTGYPVKRLLKAPDSPPFNWDFAAIREKNELPRPEVRRRRRGGEGLKPYDLGKAVRRFGSADATEALLVDPDTKAPLDQ